MRKSFAQLRTDFFRAFPDPSTDQIDGGRLYDLLKDLMDSLQPTYGVLQTSSAVPIQIVLGTVPVKIPWESVYVESVEFDCDAAAGTIRSTQDVATVRTTLNIDVAGANGRTIDFVLYADGVPTAWRVQFTGSGVTQPDAIGMTAILNLTTPKTLSLWASAEIDNTTVDLSNAFWVAENVPRAGV